MDDLRAIRRGGPIADITIEHYYLFRVAGQRLMYTPPFVLYQYYVVCGPVNIRWAEASFGSKQLFVGIPKVSGKPSQIGVRLRDQRLSAGEYRVQLPITYFIFPLHSLYRSN